MNPRRRGVQARGGAAALAVLIALSALSSCASKPKIVPPANPGTSSASPAKLPSDIAPPPTAPSPPPLAPDAPAQAQPAARDAGGTALKTADPAALARGREEREAIENPIVFGSPSSLAKARDLASRGSVLKAEDAAALKTIALGVAALIYPEPLGSPQAGLRPNGEAEPSATVGGLVKALAEVASGKFPEVPTESAGSPLGELIPALIIFADESSDSARHATDSLDRFSRLGVPSIVPSLIRGVAAERSGDAQGALALYRSALAIAPDAWVATLGSGRALLALKRGADALAALTPLAAAHTGVPAFDRAYALALCANGRYAEAEPFVARVLTRDPQDSRFILIRARLLVRAKAYPQALPLLDAYGTVDSTNRLYLLLRSLESEGLRAREEALRWARKGLAAYPDDPELLTIAARLLFAGPAFGREEARTLAARAVDLCPPDASAPPDTESETGPVLLAARNAAGVEASRLLALDAASRFRWADAAAYLKRAGSTFDDKALAARILLRSGNAKASLELASAWYKAEPRSDAAVEAYLRALVETGDEKTAQESIARLLPGTISQSLRSILYFLQSKIQKSDEASLTLLRAALVENADNSEALAAMSDIHLRRKDYVKARFYLKQAMAIDPGNPELDLRLKQLDAAAPK
jgi:tetratricopeptide (TPR) repeat protein